MDIRTTAAFHGIKIPERNEAAGGRADALADAKLNEKQKEAIERSILAAQERIKAERNGERSSN